MDENIAIILPTCNRPMSLESCVSACLSQICETDHIFVINDGEPGSVKTFKDKRITVLEHCRPYFASASARNVGIREAVRNGFTYGLFVDDDIMIHDNAVDLHKESLKNATSETILHIGQIYNVGSKVDVRRSGRADGILKFGGMVNSSINLVEFIGAGGYNEAVDGEWGFGDTIAINMLVLKYGWTIVRVDAECTHLRMPPGAPYYNRQTYAKNEKLFKELISEYEKGH